MKPSDTEHHSILEKTAFSPEMLLYLEGTKYVVEHPLHDNESSALKGSTLSQDECESFFLKILRDEGHVQFDSPEVQTDLYRLARQRVGPSKASAYSLKNLAFEYRPDLRVSNQLYEIDKVYEIFEKYASCSLETLFEALPVTPEESVHILYFITALERFLHTKFMGQKRFSIEGSEASLFVLFVLKRLFFQEKTSLTVGMSHRGRIAAMATIFQKPLEELFQEFLHIYQSNDMPKMGDVKYHKGYSFYDEKSRSSCTLLPNSSHLESVYPIALGATRREQDLHGTQSHAAIICHGDAAISGQGVVYEALQMQSLQAYQTGGTIHVIIDNQVGFTASPTESRSTPRPTDIFVSFSNPVLHVRDESPIDVLRAAYIAFLIRQKTQRDVAIRILGVRKWGHNETDDPTFTQPSLYKWVKQSHRPAYEYIIDDFVHSSKMLSDVKIDAIQKDIHEKLHAAYRSVTEQKCVHKQPKEPLKEEKRTTEFSVDDILPMIEKLYDVPSEFHLHQRIRSILEKRKETIEEKRGNTRLDWSYAEAIAFMLLLKQEKIVRLVGQDVERGTFSHRHAAFIDQETERSWAPHRNVGNFYVYNSHLSEYAALGFEYGYSLQNVPETVAIWEAQFGDFVNGAQIVIDQYISAGFEKWGSRNNVVLLLPHGYEGQGPEHSSCRLERFLSLCHENNMTVAFPSMPDTYVKLLLRQAKRRDSSPLVVLTPKAMLRDPRATSTLAECVEGPFIPIKVLHKPHDISGVTTVYLSTGKFSIELSDVIAQRKAESHSILHISLEVLSPFPHENLRALFQDCPRLHTIIWAQEEPINMGGAQYVERKLREYNFLKKGCSFISYGRKESASPATGYAHVHTIELQELEKALFSTFALSKEVSHNE